MSYYTDATIADLGNVLRLISLDAEPATMAARFIADSGDADLVQVLQHLGQDASGYTVKGWLAFPGDFRALVDALQGIEDNTSVTVTIQVDQSGGTLEVNAGGTDVVFP